MRSPVALCPKPSIVLVRRVICSASLMFSLLACQATTRTLAPKQGEDSGPRTQSSGNTTKRAAGAPCALAEECESEQCLLLDEKMVCAQRCFAATDCQGGLVCQPTQPRDANSPQICAPLQRDMLCQTCSVDADCGGMANICVNGSCGRDCKFDRECPTGYECRGFAADGSAATADNKVSEQCVPRLGTCDCNENTRGQKRPCSKSNDAGTCGGFEACEPGKGYIGCDAAIAEPESCNGLDDDCDGSIDETVTDATKKLQLACGNGHGPCKGVMTCQNGQFGGCTAPLPTAEACDSVDNDCDGEVDEDFAGDVNNCGGCGVVCAPGPALDGTTQRNCGKSGGVYSCNAIRCHGNNYDADGQLYNGCETADDAPAHYSSATAINSGCVVDDWDNSWCSGSGRFPSDSRQHTSSPTNRFGPSGLINSEDWYVHRAEDDDFADLQVRSWLDVRNAPSGNLYEVCQSSRQNNTVSAAASCGAPPSTAYSAWCSGYCCCAYGGSTVGIPLSAGDTDPSGDDNTGFYYTRIRWKSGTTSWPGSYGFRVCDESGDRHCL